MLTVTTEELTIEIDPESEQARILSEAVRTSAVLVSNGARYRIRREDEGLWAGYDPKRVRDALRAAGTLTSEEGERLKELIYRGREEGTRPLNRP